MRFKVNNSEWEIIEKTHEEMIQEITKRKGKIEEDSMYYGLTYTDLNKIYLNKELCLDRQKSTLLHELMHCYIQSFITHIDKNYCEEEICDMFSNAYTQLSGVYEEYFNKGRK